MALESLLLVDGDLIARDSNERSISHKLAEHLQALFPGWNVDCEYNRQGERTKTLPAYRGEIRTDGPESVSVFPDIIIHKRGHPDNLLVIELKKSTNPESPEHDIAKLRAFTVPEYNYDLGLFVRFDVQARRVGSQRWFKGGVEIGVQERS